jgi:hypothetical protein
MDQEAPARKPGTFLPGHDPRRSTLKARQKGQLNRIPTDLKRDCLEGFKAHGFDGRGKDGIPGFIRYLSAKHPKVAGKILERLLPLSIHASGASSVAVGGITIVSVPSGEFFNQEMAAKLREPPLQLEHEPLEQPEPAPVEDPVAIEPEQLEPEHKVEREPVPDVETGMQVIRSMSLARRRQG